MTSILENLVRNNIVKTFKTVIVNFKSNRFLKLKNFKHIRGKKHVRRTKAALVFGPEARAPHGIFIACGRTYSDMVKRGLETPGAVDNDMSTKKEVLQVLQNLNECTGLRHNNRLPYLYSIWKAKKESWRWIPGTPRERDDLIPDKAGR